ncbi:MAG: DUF308 domain-containing protein [Bacilli bacterium]|nr:DUF308 domain-containing protein [Bacilli bacterium]
MEKESKLNLLLTGFLSLFFGITLVVATEELLISINYVLVCIFLIIGVIQIIAFFINQKYKDGNYTPLIIGTVLIWLSLFIYIYYRMLIIILPIILSLYSVIMGVVLLIKYINLKNILKIKYKRYLVLSILSFIVSILLITRPRWSVYKYFQITGIYIIFIAFSYILEFLAYNKKNKVDLLEKK